MGLKHWWHRLWMTEVQRMMEDYPEADKAFKKNKTFKKESAEWTWIPATELKTETIELEEIESENQRLRRILERTHEGYRECMKESDFQINYMSAFHEPMKEAASILRIPLWDKVTARPHGRMWPWIRLWWPGI